MTPAAALDRLKRHAGPILLAIAGLMLVDSWLYLPPAIAARQNDLFAVSRELIPVGQAALHMLVFAAWWLVIRRALPIWGIGATVIAGLLVQRFELIDGLLFRWALGAGLYPSANPQWIKLALLGSAMLILWSLVAIRRTRSLDRLFMAVIVTMNLVLVTLFHLVLVEGALRATTQRSAHLMQTVIRAPEPAYSHLCGTLELECYGWADGAAVPALSPAETMMLLPLLAQTVTLPEAEHTWLYSRDFSVTNHVQASYLRSGKTNRLIIDDGPLTHATRRYQAWFYLLQIAATYGWLFGGLLVLTLHKRRLGRRRFP